MNGRAHIQTIVLASISVLTVAGAIALAQPAKDTKPATPATPTGAPQLPAGWTPEDMQACMLAGIPGKMQEHLMAGVGVWNGKCKMWMAPGSEAMESENTATITGLMDGRYVRCDMAGDMPGMGEFKGQGTYGFDNVSQKFQGTWIDNMSTGIMMGTGELSADGSTMTWNYTYTCPITKKAAVMREVEKMTGKDTKVMTMYGNDPKSGKEFKMMEIAFTRKAGETAKAKN